MIFPPPFLFHMPALKACKHSHIQQLPWNVKIKLFNAEIVARLICGCLCGAAKTRVVASDSLTRKSSIPESGLSCLDGGWGPSKTCTKNDLWTACSDIYTSKLDHTCVCSKQGSAMAHVGSDLHFGIFTDSYWLSTKSIGPTVILGIPCNPCGSWGSMGMSQDSWIFQKRLLGILRSPWFFWSFQEFPKIYRANVCLEDFPLN